MGGAFEVTLRFLALLVVVGAVMASCGERRPPSEPADRSPERPAASDQDKAGVTPPAVAPAVATGKADAVEPTDESADRGPGSNEPAKASAGQAEVAFLKAGHTRRADPNDADHVRSTVEALYGSCAQGTRRRVTASDWDEVLATRNAVLVRYPKAVTLRAGSGPAKPVTELLVVLDDGKWQGSVLGRSGAALYSPRFGCSDETWLRLREFAGD